MTSINKSNIFSILLPVFLLITLPTSAQEEGGLDAVDRDLKIEIEPASFILRGFAASAIYNITEDNNLALGAYAASVDVPTFPRKYMFDETVGGDTSSARLGFQISLMARYRLKLFKNWQSNPYVGMIAGWEYFDVEQPSYPETVRLKTWLVTPYVGYEFYFFKQMLFLNAQVRSVIYFGQSSDTPSRPERVGTFLLLPQVSLGVRL